MWVMGGCMMVVPNITVGVQPLVYVWRVGGCMMVVPNITVGVQPLVYVEGGRVYDGGT